MNRARALLGLLAPACPLAALAAEPPPTPGGWWGGIDYGYASVKRNYSVTGDVTQHKAAIGLRAGYAWDPRLLLGVELGGWLLKGANVWHPNEGEGVQTASLIAQLYPLAAPLHFKAGAGRTKYWNESPQETGGRGSGGVLGVGYDVHLRGMVYFTPSIDFSWGRIHGATSPPGVTQDQKYRAVSFKIGLTFR